MKPMVRPTPVPIMAPILRLVSRRQRRASHNRLTSLRKRVHVLLNVWTEEVRTHSSAKRSGPEAEQFVALVACLQSIARKHEDRIELVLKGEVKEMNRCELVKVKDEMSVCSGTLFRPPPPCRCPRFRMLSKHKSVCRCPDCCACLVCYNDSVQYVRTSGIYSISHPSASRPRAY